MDTGHDFYGFLVADSTDPHIPHLICPPLNASPHRFKVSALKILGCRDAGLPTWQVPLAIRPQPNPS